MEVFYGKIIELNGWVSIAMDDTCGYITGMFQM